MVFYTNLRVGENGNSKWAGLLLLQILQPGEFLADERRSSVLTALFLRPAEHLGIDRRKLYRWQQRIKCFTILLRCCVPHTLSSINYRAVDIGERNWSVSRCHRSAECLGLGYILHWDVARNLQRLCS